MSVRKITSGKWLCECYPYGASGKRIRKQFATKSEALSYERRIMNSRVGDEFQDGSGPRLSELIARWFEMYGKTLSSGAERKVKLEAICSRLGDPFASQFDKNMFATYRERRLSGEWNPKGKKKLSEATVNREQSYLHAVFAELKRLGEWSGENPLTGIRKFREEEKELAFLYVDEIERLLIACDESRNKDLGVVVYWACDGCSVE